MGVDVRYDEQSDSYDLGSEVDGVFVSFVNLEGGYVRARVEGAKQSEQSEQTAETTTTEGGLVPTADDGGAGTAAA
jgi:hypothetical protein